MIIIGFFCVWSLINFLTIYFIPFFIPYLGFFPYKDQFSFHLPTWLSGLANFDGLHYLLIAKNGYSQYEQAFFPLYPVIIRFLSPVFNNNQIIPGLIISNLCFFISLFIFKKYLEALKIKSFWPIIFLLTFPTSFFFQAVYTEGLFLLLLIVCLYSLKKEQYFFAGLIAILASLTRLVGIFLTIPFLVQFFEKWSRTKPSDRAKFNLGGWLWLIMSPLVGLFFYRFYLWKTTSDPLFFFTSQPAFGANRSTKIILLPRVYYRYLRIFLTAQFNFQYFISLVEIIFFSSIFLLLLIDLIKNLKLKTKNYSLIGLNLFSLANIVLPTFTGTFSSVPRYALFSLSFFIALSQIKNVYVKLLLVISFLFFHIMLFGFFIQGYFVS